LFFVVEKLEGSNVEMLLSELYNIPTL